MEANVRAHLKVIWDWMHLDMPLEKADCIVGFGCYNDDIPLRCAALYHEGWADKVLFTGGLGRNTLGLWEQSEAERFAAIAVKEGVPEGDILIENRSTNSAENILFTRDLLQERGFADPKLLCVHKPFMERRLMAAMGVYWPQCRAVYTSPQLSLDEYIRNSVAQGLSEQTVIDVIVGDFQRMDVYAKKGFQLPQDIPQACWDAFEALVALGCTSELVK